MDVEQGFLGKNGPAHHTFIYLPVKKNKKNKNYCLNRKQLDLKHRQRCKEDKRTWTAWLSLRAEGAGCYCECQRWKQIWRPWGTRGICGRLQNEPCACDSLPHSNYSHLQTPADNRDTWVERRRRKKKVNSDRMRTSSAKWWSVNGSVRKRIYFTWVLLKIKYLYYIIFQKKETKNWLFYIS